MLNLAIDIATLEGIKKIAREQKVTLFMALTAALYVFLYRISGQTDLSIGTAVANRMRGELERILGTPGLSSNTFEMASKSLA